MSKKKKKPEEASSSAPHEGAELAESSTSTDATARADVCNAEGPNGIRCEREPHSTFAHRFGWQFWDSK